MGVRREGKRGCGVNSNYGFSIADLLRTLSNERTEAIHGLVDTVSVFVKSAWERSGLYLTQALGSR